MYFKIEIVFCFFFFSEIFFELADFGLVCKNRICNVLG